MVRSMTGAELKRLRERAGLAQQALAALADVAARTIIRWEQGETEIPALAARGLHAIFEELKRKK
jgi:transcriptional regulator with XRE-family HTH domain